MLTRGTHPPLGIVTLHVENLAFLIVPVAVSPEGLGILACHPTQFTVAVSVRGHVPLILPLQAGWILFATHGA